jgi:DMSO/TMAO reductase YedYZ molybdopterin-dependent catalytic subunit
MTRFPVRRWLQASLASMLVGVAVFQAQAADPISEQVVISGTVKTALTLKVDDLKTFPSEQIDSLSVTRRVDGKELVSTVRGVKLTAALERAGFLSSNEHEWKHAVVLATATDGYQVVFSWPELFNTDVGGGALIVFERDGKPLPDREGRIALVSGKDLRAGPRSVRWLARLEVRVLK